jgi:hypothetical protein
VICGEGLYVKKVDQEYTVLMEPPFREDLSPEADDWPLLESVIWQLYVKGERDFVKYGNTSSVIVICDYDV